MVQRLLSRPLHESKVKNFYQKPTQPRVHAAASCTYTYERTLHRSGVNLNADVPAVVWSLVQIKCIVLLY